MPDVKIVILNWNGERHLRRFLPSVVAAAPAHVGVVVADNGSTDASVEFLRSEYPSVEIVELGRNYGYAEGYNRALEGLRGDYFVLLNSDVETPAGWYEPLERMMESDDRIAAVSPKILSVADPSSFEYAGAAGGFIDSLGYPFCRGRILSAIEKDAGQYDAARGVFWASGACMMIRADVFRELGGFDAKFFAHMEEIDLCWRAQLAGYKVMCEPAGAVYHLGGGTLPNNTPHKIYLNYRNNLAMLYKNLPEKNVELVLATRMVLDGASAAVFALQGRFSFVKAIWKAHRDYIKWKPELTDQRSRIQLSAAASPEYIYKGFIVLRYLLGKRTFGKMM